MDRFSKSKDKKVKGPSVYEGGDKYVALTTKASMEEDEARELYEDTTPLEDAGCCGRLFFTWANPIISFTNSDAKLETKHLGKIRECDSVEVQRTKFVNAYYGQTGKRSLWSAILSAFGGELMCMAGLGFISMCVGLCMPFFVKALVAYIKDGKNPHPEIYEFPTYEDEWLAEHMTPDRQYGLAVALAMVFIQGFTYVLDENKSFGCRMLGAKASNALVVMLYEKQLRLYPSSDFSTGEIVNFSTTDAGKVNWFCMMAPWAFTIPFQLTCCLALLFYYMGVSFFAGIGVCFITVTTQFCLGKAVSYYQRLYMKGQDKRVALETESLSNVKMLKLYSWSDSFLDKIGELRNAETDILWKKKWLEVGQCIAYAFLPVLLKVVAFVAFFGLGNEMTVENAFAILTVLGIIYIPMGWLPMFIGQQIEFSISIERLERFFEQEEINTTVVAKKDENSDVSIEGNWLWGFNKSEAEKQKLEAAKKEEKKAQDETGFNTLDQAMTLHGMNLTLKQGQFTAIIGDVGSGKSSVLSTLIGDLRHLGKDFTTITDQGSTLTTEVKRQLSDNGFQKKFDKDAAPVVIPSNISYTQQTPWIQNKTIRENIVAFGPPIEDNMDRYKHVIKICELKRDLQTALKAGDRTEIGEKGINLSGGQKARIGLARSVYADTDVYLMDDPLSALDANVKKSIFENVFRGELWDKTRILVTHAIDFLPFVDNIVVMHQGKVLLEGKYSDIESHEYMQALLDSHEQNAQTNTAINAEKAVVKSASEISDFDPDAKQLEQGEGKMMSNENDEVIQVNFGTYKRYFLEYYGGWRFVFTSQLAMILFLTSQFMENYIVGAWADDPKQAAGVEGSQYVFYMSCSFGICVFIIFVNLLRGSNILLGQVVASRKVHGVMLRSIFEAPLTTYFDVTPIGRILNRFSKDINTLDESIGWTIDSVNKSFWLLQYSLIVSMLTVWQTVFMIPLIFCWAGCIVSRAAAAIKETVRLEAVSKSPVLSHFGESLPGGPTIRAFQRQDEFIQKMYYLGNRSIQATAFVGGAQGWFAIRVDVLAFTCNLILTIVPIFARDMEGIDKIMLALLIPALLSIQGNLIWGLKSFLNLQGMMVASERCMNLADIAKEAYRDDERPEPNWLPEHGVPNIEPSQLVQSRPNWPETGELEFKDVVMRYRPDTDVVLNKLTFKIEAGHKVGIVGRTGAGKSTLALCISRITELDSGSIVIDGVDIAKERLHEVRSRLTVVPQDATMFTGTLRFNLDPENTCTDDEIKALLRRAELSEILDNNEDGLYQAIKENGSNFSSGERQLICICRAILRKSKLVLLDEATANIDIKTEHRIQELINSEFKDATMITIAHRLQTIMASDKVMVLSFGQVAEYDTPDNLKANPESEFAKLCQELESED